MAANRLSVEHVLMFCDAFELDADDALMLYFEYLVLVSGHICNGENSVIFSCYIIALIIY